MRSCVVTCGVVFCFALYSGVLCRVVLWCGVSCLVVSCLAVLCCVARRRVASCRVASEREHANMSLKRRLQASCGAKSGRTCATVRHKKSKNNISWCLFTKSVDRFERNRVVLTKFTLYQTFRCSETVRQYELSAHIVRLRSFKDAIAKYHSSCFSNYSSRRFERNHANLTAHFWRC